MRNALPAAWTRERLYELPHRYFATPRSRAAAQAASAAAVRSSELFSSEDSTIRRIEANFITVPYHMPSPWDGAAGQKL